MAFKLQRQKRIKETLELYDHNGQVEKTIQVDFDIDDKMMAFNKSRNEVIRVEQALKSGDTSDENLILYGEAISKLFEIVFGVENAQTVIDFYENRYVEMSEEVFPFIMEVIIPEIEKLSKEKTEKLKQKYMQG